GPDEGGTQHDLLEQDEERESVRTARREDVHEGRLPVPDLAGDAGPVPEQRVPASRHADQRPRRLSSRPFAVPGEGPAMRRPFSLLQDGHMPEAVIVSIARTPIGRAAKGSLVDARPDDLVAFAIRTGLDRVPGLPEGAIVGVIVGCGFPEARQGMNLGRRAALLAGLPETVPGTTVNRFCASSLQTIRMAFHAIRAGEGEAFVAAGVESISQVNGYPKSDEELHPALFGDNAPIANVYIPMGLT